MRVGWIEMLRIEWLDHLPPYASGRDAPAWLIWTRPPARSVQARARHFPPEFYVRRRSDECHRVGSVWDRPQHLRVNSAPALRDFSRPVHQTFLQTRWHIRCPVLRSETESPRLRSTQSDCAPSPDR